MDEARLYTLRVWQHAREFRAVLRAVGDEHAELFTEPAAVAAYLQRASGAGAPPLLARNGGETPAADHAAADLPSGRFGLP
jgi:hypothetical protein